MLAELGKCCEFEMFVERNGSLICRTHAKVNTGGAQSAQCVEQSAHHCCAEAATLRSREQVDVQMRRVCADVFVWCEYRPVHRPMDLLITRAQVTSYTGWIRVAIS